MVYVYNSPQRLYHRILSLYRYNLQKQLALITLGYEKDGLTLEPQVKYNVETQEASPILSLSQKKGADTLKATYDINGESGSLEWNHKPYKVTSSTSVYAVRSVYAELFLVLQLPPTCY